MSSVNSKKEYLISEGVDNSMLERIHVGLEKAGIPKRGRNGIVATKTGYSPSMVAKLLSGHAKLSWRFINTVCSSFNITGEWVGEGLEPVLEHVYKEIEAERRAAQNERTIKSLDNLFGTQPVISVDKEQQKHSQMFIDKADVELIKKVATEIASGANRKLDVKGIVRNEYDNYTSEILSPFSKLEIIEKRSILREINKLLQLTGRGVYEHESPDEVVRMMEEFVPKEIAFISADTAKKENK